MSQEKTKIILDVDTGVDDALAILYALRSEHLDVIGITTCYGNVDVDTATQNTLRLVELAGKKVPVYRGSERPLLGIWLGPVPWIHGDNGLGNAELVEPTSHAEAEDAVHFIRRAIATYPGEVVVIPVARMTNVALALAGHPELLTQLKRIVVMGGAAFCPGNVTAVAEANIWGDPEAAKWVFNSGVPITMVGLDVTMKVTLTQTDISRLPATLPYAKLVQQATSFYMEGYRDTQGTGLWCPLHDPLAVAVAEDPTLCTTQRLRVDVETHGLLTSGMTVVDARASALEGQIDVCVDVDVRRFLTRFKQVLGIPGEGVVNTSDAHLTDGI